MDSDQRRKRKQSLLYSSKFFSLISLILCSSFFIFLLLSSSHTFSITSSSSRPLITVSNFPFLLSTASNSVHDFISKSFSKIRIEDTILFPDHVLLLVTPDGVQNSGGGLFNCVYYEQTVNDTSDEFTVIRPVLSVKDYDEHRSIVRCPIPSQNYSAAVNLQRQENSISAAVNKTIHSWEKLVYEAALDGDTVVVFVKGLNLRSDKESDPTQFNCHFGLGNWGKIDKFVLTTKAVTAAQEVVRCLLPRGIQKNPSMTQGLTVTIGVDVPSYIHGHVNKNAPVNHVILPSVAKISNFNKESKTKEKYELCVCTMVWNQASSLSEWITYHSWLGVERWFIYDNNSDDEIEKVIEELNLENYNVTKHTWPWIKTQEAGFSHCVIRARHECNWVGFFDVDEFFYFPSPSHRSINAGKVDYLPGKNSLQSLVANLSSSSTIGEIRTACHSFGPSGLTSPPPHGVTVGYTCRVQSPERHKSIVRLDALDSTLVNVVHHFHLKKGFKYINLLQSTALINHYKYQVWETFKAKFYRRVATYVVDWRENQNEGSKDRAPGLGTEPIEPPNWRLQFCETSLFRYQIIVLDGWTENSGCCSSLRLMNKIAKGAKVSFKKGSLAVIDGNLLIDSGPWYHQVQIEKRVKFCKKNLEKRVANMSN